MLAAKKDSPIRLLPLARYVTMKESTLPDREIPDDEKECISQSEAEENAEKSTTYLAFICAILIVVGIILEATVNAELTDPQN
ncbi:Oidioi.mRNA.OKI2018_I69.chr2.g7392.t1.cds [Oikopleura dioica]|uniref:Oidioi.mRNA.OKI2018_I69.chr2.g7392.t1.cds n=1 Tax=Oikopleura dioica TaxID=34765 RepID=A0ABN7T616_OIKDI|nr:Oidioi.mRNA.OKI2018_I69.chr2.g7392.t1.cds [Oikopleura dioica]